VDRYDFHDLPGLADFAVLGTLLESFADDWRGWTGERACASADGDFALKCTHDQVGQVWIHVYLKNYVEDWEVNGLLVRLEAGRLEEVRREAAAFFGALGESA
jgi:hypothetical protein